MRSPERFLSIPVYCEEWQPIRSSKIGVVQAPKVSRLDIDNVFNGESTCILDFISRADDGEYDDPLFFMVIVKKGTRSTSGGWVCDYDSKLKVVMLGEGNAMSSTPYTPATVPSQSATQRVIKPSRDEVDAAEDMLTDFDEADFSDVPTSRWGESSEDDSHTDGGDTPIARNLRNQFVISEDDRKDRTREMKAHIDGSKYVVYTSKRLDQMTVRWRDREMKTHRHKYTEAVKKLAQIPGAKVMHASRTSKVSKHTLAECIKRAQEWQNWHREAVRFIVRPRLFLLVGIR